MVLIVRLLKCDYTVHISLYALLSLAISDLHNTVGINGLSEYLFPSSKPCKNETATTFLFDYHYHLLLICILIYICITPNHLFVICDSYAIEDSYLHCP